MAKRINKNMVAGLAFLGFGVMTAAGVLMILAMRNTDPARFVEIAERHVEEEEWLEAGLYYRKAYDVSQDEKYLVDVGQMIYNGGNEAKAQQVWQTAATHNPQLVPALVKLMDYAAEIVDRFPNGNTWRRVRETSDALLKQMPEDPQALYNRGRAILAVSGPSPEEREPGIKDLRRAIEIAPENVDYSLAMAMLEAQEGSLDSADEFFEGLLAANSEPGNDAFKVRSLYARLLTSRSAMARANKNNAESAEFSRYALSLLEEAVTLAGTEPEDQISARVQLGRYLVANKLRTLRAKKSKKDELDVLVARVQNIYDQAVEIDPEGFEAYLALAELYRALGKPDQAIEFYERRLGTDIDRKGLKGWQRKRDLFRLLIGAADTCVASAKDYPFASSERAALLDKGERFIRDAKAEMPSSPQSYHYEGKLLLARGKDLLALTAFEEADRRYGAPNEEVRIYLASLYLVQKQVGAARKALVDVVKNPKAGAQAWLTFGRVMLEAGDAKRATEAAQQALLRAPHSRDILLLLAEGFRQMDRPDLVDQMMSQLKDGPENAFVRIRVLLGQEQYEEALVQLNELLSSDPGNSEAAIMVVRLLRKLERPDEVRAVVQAAIEANPGDLRLAKLALALDDQISAEERETRYVAIIEGVEDAYVRAMELATYHQSKAQWDDAEKYLGQAEQLLIDRATPVAIERTRSQGETALRETSDRRFNIICSRKDWAAAEQMAQEAASRNIDGVDGLTYFGRIQLFRGEAELAADNFRQALDRQPNNSQTLTFLGQAYLNLKQLDQAKLAFEQAAKLNLNNGLAHKGLAMLAKFNKDATTYHTHLTECLRLRPFDEWVIREIAEIQRLTNPQESLAEYEQKWKDDPQDVQTLLRLADLYARLGRVDDASARYDDARAASPDSMLVAHTSSEFERLLGSKVKAEEIIQQFLDSRSDPRIKAAAYIALAQFHTKVDDPEKAGAAFLAAADLNQSAPILWAAGRHFFVIGHPGMAIDWLKRASQKAAEEGDQNMRLQIDKMCAEAYLEAGDLKQAKVMVDELLAGDDTPGNLALMFKAEIEARLGRFDQAVETLSEYLEVRPDEPLALFRRARYRGVQGKWPLAITDLELLRARHPRALDAAPRMRLAIAYERVGRVDSAIQELENLLKERPDDSDLAIKLIDMLIRNDNFDGADRTCRMMSNRQPNNPVWVYQRARVPLGRADQTDDEPSKKRLANEALGEMRKACRMAGFAPVMVIPYLNACLYYEAYAPGIDLYESRLTMAQRVPPVTKAYAGLLAKTGAVDLAISAYRRAAHVGRKQNGAIFVQAIVSDAVRVLGTDAFIALLRQPPSDERLLLTNQMLWAAALTLKEQYSEANALLRQLLDQSTEDTDRAVAWLLMGMTADGSGDFEQARRAYEEVIKLEPLNWVAHNNMAYLLCDGLQRCEEALPYAQRAMSLASQPAVADTLATVFMGLNRDRDAVGVLGRSLNDDPGFAPGYLRLAEAYRRLGEFDLAKSVLEQVRTMPQSGADEFARELDALFEKVSNRDSSQ